MRRVASLTSDGDPGLRNAYADAMAPWKAYRLRIPPRGTFGKAERVSAVHHATHVESALRIVADGAIRAVPHPDGEDLGLGDRPLVWLAPNHWRDGSMYGTTRFSFDWAKLVKGCRIYWVEGADEPISLNCCLFITASKAHRPRLIRYRPKKSKGPLRIVRGEWWWRSDVSLKLIFDRDLDLAGCTELNFIEHHHSGCVPGPRARCAEALDRGALASARVMAALLSGKGHLRPAALFAKGRQRSQIQIAIHRIREVLDATDCDLHGPLRKRRHVDAAVRAALHLLASGETHSAAETAALVGSDGRVDRSLVRMLAALER